MADQEASISFFPQSIPKLELHAHLNGSLSRRCLNKLAALKANQNSGDYNLAAFDDLQSCFDVFAIAHALTDTPAVVKLAAKYCIDDFAADNVVYLELRSTPRATDSMTKSDYISAILEAIAESALTTTLIVSINRGNSVKEAFENVNLAIDFAKIYPNVVVGVDLCGNPCEGKFSEFIPVLNLARENYLKITLHCGEIKNDEEVLEMIRFQPDRLAHVTCLTIEAVEKIQKLKIPVELCVTSNLKCKTVKSVSEHQLRFYVPSGHPFILGTDDKGVFDTTLNSEYSLVQKAFNLSDDFFWGMNKSAVEFSFAPESVKKKLREKFNNY